MAADSLFISELLCYFRQKYGKVPNSSLKAVVVSFYTPCEISAAKENVFKAAASLNLDGLPRMVSRRMSDDKPRLDTEDIFGLFEALDEKTALGNLPSFVALDLSRVPPFNTGDLDMAMLMMRVANLESRMAGIVGDCVTAVQDQLMQAPSASVAASTDVRVSDKPVPSTDVDEPPQTASEDGSWVSVSRRKKMKTSKPAASLTGDQSTTASVMMEQHNPKRLFSGSAASSTTVTAVPRKLHAFVSRLNKDTTVEQLVSWFDGIGITGVICRKITPPEGMSFSTAAFKVSCDAKYEEKFYDDKNWPAGCDVRDWVIRKFSRRDQSNVSRHDVVSDVRDNNA